MKSLTASRTAATLLLAAMIPLKAVSAQDKGLAPPTQLWAAQTDPNTITLVWQGVSGAVQYLVFGPKSKKGDAGPAIQQLAALGRSASRYVALVAGSGISHQFSIQAVDAKGRVSDKVEFNPVIPEAKQASAKTVPPPSSVTARETRPGEIRIIWPAVPGATAYLLSRSVAPGGFGTLCSLCPTGTNYADKRVTAGAKHIYTVAAITPFGTSKKTWSNEVTPTGGRAAGNTETGDTEGPPKGVTNPKATLKSPTSVEVTWGGGAGATAIQIYRTLGTGKEELVATLGGTATSFLDHWPHGFFGGASYGIRAVNAKGSAETATVTLVAGPPNGVTNPKATLKSPTSAEVTWGGGAGATAIQIYRTLGTGKEELVATLGGTATSYLDHWPHGWFGGASYGLRAVNAKGSSETATVTIAPEKAATDPAVSTPSPKGPSGLKATVVSTTLVRLTWSPGVVGGMYRVMREGSGAKQVIATLPGSVSTFMDHFPPGGMPGTIGYWIEVVDGKGASEKVTVTMDPAKDEGELDSLPPRRGRP